MSRKIPEVGVPFECGESSCPVCGQDAEIDYGDAFSNPTEATQVGYCYKCGARWRDIYEYKHTILDEKEES